MKGSFHRGPWSLRGLERLVRRCPVGGVQGTSARHEEPPGAWGQTSGARRGHSSTPQGRRSRQPEAGRPAVQTRSHVGGQCQRSGLRREWAADRAGDRGEAAPRNGGGPGARLPHGGPARAPAHAPGILWRGARSV